MNKKFLAVLCGVILVAGFVLATGRVSAQANSDFMQSLREQIQALLDKIKALQDQLATAQGSGTQWCHTFNTNLKIGDQNDEVTNLDRALVKEGFLSQDVFQDGRTALNFDEMTASAVSGFQEKYRSEILTPNGLKSGTGYVGPSTRKKLNQLYGCGDNVVRPKPDSAIVVTYPQSGQVVSSPLKISGYVSNGKWGVFEGEAGNVSLFDSSGRKLGNSILKVTNFGYEPSITQFNFEGLINFPVPQTGTGYLLFAGNDPSGFRPAGEFRVEVRFSQVPINHPPKISLTSPIPSSISTSQLVTFVWTASDPDGDLLRWKLMSQSGDEILSCNGRTTCSQTFKWFEAGVYAVKMAVFDGKGSAAESDTPVTVAPVSTQFNVFFFNPKLSPSFGSGSYFPDDTPTFPVARSVSYTPAIATAAVNELLKGPTTQEKSQGYTTNIPLQAKLLSLKIENGVAYADFNSQTQTGGSSNPQTLLIEKTLMQFPMVKKVVFSVEGQTGDIFQP